MGKNQTRVRYYYCGPMPWRRRWPLARLSRYLFTFLIGVVTGLVISAISNNHAVVAKADVFETGKTAYAVSATSARSAGLVPRATARLSETGLSPN